MAFCLYVAARVFVQYLKKNSHDSQIRMALQFLLTAMEAMKLKNPLTESFLVQLHLDIKGNGLDIFFHNPDYSSLYLDGKVCILSVFDVYRIVYIESNNICVRWKPRPAAHQLSTSTIPHHLKADLLKIRAFQTTRLVPQDLKPQQLEQNHHVSHNMLSAISI